MKVGDTLLSKRDFGWIYSGKIYYVRAVNRDNTQVFMSTSPEHNQGHWFTLEPERDYNELYLYYIFYTKQEYRKLKLNEIESRR